MFTVKKQHEYQKTTTLFKQRGFSLVELSVVLTIIGLTLGTALSLATNITEQDRIDTTEERMTVIEKALAVHLSMFGRLPCPANGTLAPSATNHGWERTTSLNPTVCNALLRSTNVVGGVVPTKTLGLPDEMMEDGWGRRFTYVVDERFTSSSLFNAVSTYRNPDCDNSTSDACYTYFDPAVGTITIYDAATGTPGSRTTEAVVTLISHGKNGHGAYLRQGSANRMNAGYTTAGGENESAEAENGALGSGVDGKDFDNIFVQKDSTGLFDDIVHYFLKWQLAEDAGGITDDSTCAAAENVLNADADVICTGSTGTSCAEMAQLVYNRCLEME